MKRGLLIFFFSILPKAFLSRIFGVIARMRFPRSILVPVMEWYCDKYPVKMDEFDQPDEGFKTLDQFFTRRLKKGIHIIDSNPMAVVSPVDARIDQFGEITGTRVMQAKDIDYLVSDLIPASIHHSFLDGTFVTLYLSPADYHRIHSPIDATISGSLHVPGKLFPVMELMVNGINGLFSKNERIITYLQSEYGICAVSKIGAMNVGRISVSYNDFISNDSFFRSKREMLFSKEFRPHVHRGDELGIFHLGSTVILLFQKGMVNLDRLLVGQRVRVGQRIGELVKKHNS